MDTWIAALSPGLSALHQSIVVKLELSQKERLSIYWSIFTLTISCGHKIREETEIDVFGYLDSALEIF